MKETECSFSFFFPAVVSKLPAACGSARRTAMADDNEELQADEELPAPAEDAFEQLENDSPAERSGHVAVTDGRCMYVWGGYKVRCAC